ncbi:MAG: hypothetical protein EOM21_19730 [Gammaproteobacteria bacterium]|nr:hypothetical protein [Gammaproteobacteria bacterium]
MTHEILVRSICVAVLGALAIFVALIKWISTLESDLTWYAWTAIFGGIAFIAGTVVVISSIIAFHEDENEDEED